jgi:hypothetical protein
MSTTRAGQHHLGDERMIPFKTLVPMRLVDSDDATDVELVRNISNSYQPPILFTRDDLIYTDGNALYGHVIQYGTDGKPALNRQHDGICTKFMRVPIPEKTQCLQ